MATPGHAAPASRAEKGYRRALKRLRREIRRLTKIAEDNRDLSRAGRVFSHEHLVAETQSTMVALKNWRPDAVEAAKKYVDEREATVAAMARGDNYRGALDGAAPIVRTLRKSDRLLASRLADECDRVQPPSLDRVQHIELWLRNLLTPGAPTSGIGYKRRRMKLERWHIEAKAICDAAEGFDAANDLIITVAVCNGFALDSGYCDSFVRSIENGFNWLDDWIEEHPADAGDTPAEGTSCGASPLVQVEIDVLMALGEAHPAAELIQDVADRAGYTKNRKLVSKTLSGLANRLIPLTVRKSLRKGYGLTDAGVELVDNLIKRASTP